MNRLERERVRFRKTNNRNQYMGLTLQIMRPTPSAHTARRKTTTLRNRNFGLMHNMLHMTVSNFVTCVSSALDDLVEKDEIDVF